MHLKPGEEVIIQGYTCVAVPNAIHTAGGVPVYVDIRKETLNIDPERVRSAITHRTRAIICQHTFAIPGPLEELRAICNEHKLALIEDCAHILPDASGPSGIAQTGDFAFFSFGRDKAATGIIGGAVISRSAAVSAQLTHEERQAAAIPFSVVLRLLLYPCMYLIARPFYGLKIGKLFLFVMKKLHMLIPILTTQEKCGKMSPVLHSMPNACAYLAQFQLTRHQAVNDHRRALTRYYLTEARKHDWKFPAAIKDDLPMQKFPLFVSKPEILRTTLKKHNIHLHDGWTQAVICPHSVNQSAMNYRPGSCPNAEQVARSVVTLPTHPTMTMRQACRLCEMIESLMK
jgi:dTDP-4-amino-4,6-dideoxygalactose transaminase